MILTYQSFWLFEGQLLGLLVFFLLLLNMESGGPDGTRKVDVLASAQRDVVVA